MPSLTLNAVPMPKLDATWAVAWLGLLICFAAFFWYDFLAHALLLETPRLTVLVAGIGVAALVTLASRGPAEAIKSNLPVLFAAIIFLGAGLISVWSNGMQINHAVLSISPLIALVICGIGKERVKTIVAFTLMTTFGIQIFEQSTGQLLFIYTTIDGDLLNEKNFEGSLGVFRAKGLFAGPISASCFAIMAVFLFPSSLSIHLLCLGIGVLSNSRAGTFFAILSLGALVYMYPSLRKGRTVLRVTLLLALVLTALAYVVMDLSALVSVQRLVAGLDLNDSSNQSRIYYWLASIEVLRDKFDLSHWIFGWPRSSYLMFENSAESQYLQILLDVGIFGGVFYAVAIARALFLADKLHRAVMILLLVLWIAVPPINSLGNCVMFWVGVFWLCLGGAASSRRARSSPNLSFVRHRRKLVEVSYRGRAEGLPSTGAADGFGPPPIARARPRLTRAASRTPLAYNQYPT